MYILIITTPDKTYNNDFFLKIDLVSYPAQAEGLVNMIW